MSGFGNRGAVVLKVSLAPALFMHSLNNDQFFREIVAEPTFTCGSAWPLGYQFGYQHSKQLTVLFSLHMGVILLTATEIPNSFCRHHRQLSRKHGSNLEVLDASKPHALNSQTLRTNGVKDGSAKTMACKAGGLLGLRDLSRIFRGLSGKNPETARMLQQDLQPFQHARSLQGFLNVHRPSLSQGRGVGSSRALIARRRPL